MSWRASLLLVPLLFGCVGGGGSGDEDDDGGGGDGDGGWDLGMDSGADAGVGTDGDSDSSSDTDGGTDGGDTDGGTDGGDTDGGDTDGGTDGGDTDGGTDGGSTDWDADVEGNAYRLDLAGATFVEPAGVGSLLVGSLEQDVLVQVQRQTSSALDLMFTVSESVGGPQDMCVETSMLPSADFTDAPDWDLGPTSLTMELDGYTIVMQNVRLSGTFSADGRTYDDSTLDATLDTRDLIDVMGDLLGTDDPRQICELVGGFGVSCEACPSDGAELCLGLRIEDVVARPYAAGLVIRTASDIRTDSACGE
ncbi:MAG: hypothetical protein H6742_14595 [Alphaproteobacteria bacterium]|nr:hypothetical protein [Alphaproteobacteria bacterium]